FWCIHFSVASSVLKSTGNYNGIFTLAFPCIDGVYLPKHESEFVHLVLEELDTFEQEDQRSRVLLFPPFPSRLRYLTHRTVEDRPELCSFSVGEGLLRRVAVCFCDIRSEVKEDSDLESSSLYEEVKERDSEPKPTTVKNRTPKRPDQPLYLPRAVRERQRGAGRGGGRGVREETGEGGVREEERGEIVARERQRGPEGGGSEGENRGNTTVREGEKRREEGGVREEQRGADTTVREEQRREEGVREREQRRESEGVRERLEDGSTEVNSNHDSALNSDDTEASSCTHRAEDTPPYCDLEKNQEVNRVQQEVNRAKQQVWDEDILQTEENRGDCTLDLSCESDTTGADSDTEEISQKIRAHVKGGVSFCVDPVHSDFSSFESVSVNSEEFSHVIEIYDFPVLFKTEDLLDAFTEYSDGGMKIKWVDNTHALGIFSCEAAAVQALSISHPLLKTRALSQGSKKAKGKALRRAEFLQPVKERPRTDCAVARRMVTRALGLQRRGPRY
ncbi:R3H and coiled-coil domain-containing protein 1, partial [Periophthalmus magnuspinnatus]|uniref:R3H and coiled-coil domain-containing protein 1 n=1 Tax=Periophthalmus magnuspinnatus TaxID=409849 RepID=UPI0024367296